ncbi:MAG: replication initiation protein [Propionibacteriales bacterium]|nr:replication initiation protein [Propionibacteriales bacterium]
MTGPVPVSPAVLRELATAAKVCVRPVLLRCSDTATNTTTTVPIPCGSTIERTCPTCADRARRLRMQQCREGWHRDHEPEPLEESESDEEEDSADPDEVQDPGTVNRDDTEGRTRRVRSTRRRQDVTDLPRVPMDARTLGRVFRARDGKTYRPSMFMTFTLPSYGAVRPDGTPVDPDRYDYQRAALDALHFAKLEDRLWQNLRRCAGYKVQYFAAIEAQRRLAPHLHAAVRGVIPRQIVRQVLASTYHHLWWPPCTEPVYADVDELPVWDDMVHSGVGGFVDPVRGTVLPTWDQALDDLDADPAAKPAHVLRFGRQFDYQGIIATDEHEVGRAVAYLTKYLAKDIASSHDDPDQLTPPQRDHLDRLHAKVRVLPCSPRCANWVRYGIQPKAAHERLNAGHCTAKAHDRHHLGLGGRRVHVSRQWTGKTLSEHAADRSEIVRQVLTDAGITDIPGRDRCSATTPGSDGRPRYLWTRIAHHDQDALTYREAISAAIAERVAWREQYEYARDRAGPGDRARSAVESAA